MVKHLFLLPLAAVLHGAPSNAQAQENTEQRKVRVEIITNDNGETKRVTHEFDATNEEEMQKALRDLGVLDHLSLGEKGEDVQIDIRRSFPGIDRSSWQDAGGDPLLAASGRTAFLGVSTQNLNEELIKEHGLKVKEGVYISEVTSGSAAEKVGLKAGDVIVELDGKPVRGPEELTQAVRAKAPGDKVELVWARQGKRWNGTVELGERQMEQRRFEFHGIPEEEGWNDDGPGTSGGSVAFLGVMPGTDSENGVRIGRVEEGSAAERMGLKVNDVILQVDGEAINSFEELSQIIRSHEPLETVDLMVQRDGDQLSLRGELGERKTMRWAMPYGGPGTEFNFEDQRTFDPEKLHQEMERLRREMDDLQRDLGRDLRSSTRIIIERRELSPEEKELLRAKGVEDLDQELELGGLQAFPNPSSGFYRLQFDVASAGDLGVEVYDANGERVYEERITAFKGRYERTLDLSERASGTYFLVITQNGRSSAQKLIKE
jgi:membrane-associated protease RseP (regulator of RpoE activity)